MKEQLNQELKTLKIKISERIRKNILEMNMK